jgi:hypothetical protein
VNDVQRHSNDVAATQRLMRTLYPEATVLTHDASPHKGTFVHVIDKFGRRIDARWVRLPE